MSNYATELTKKSDEELAIMLGGPMPGSTNHELIKFEMERRSMVAQRMVAEATLRGAAAAERYTRATWVLIFVTAVGTLVALFK